MIPFKRNLVCVRLSCFLRKTKQKSTNIHLFISLNFSDLKIIVEKRSSILDSQQQTEKKLKVESASKKYKSKQYKKRFITITSPQQQKRVCG